MQFSFGKEINLSRFQVQRGAPLILLQFSCLKLLVVLSPLVLQSFVVQSFHFVVSLWKFLGASSSRHVVGIRSRKWIAYLFYHSFPDLGNSLHAFIMALHDMLDSFWSGPFWWKYYFWGGVCSCANNGSHPSNCKSKYNTSSNTFKPVIFFLGLIFQYVKNYYLFRILFKPIVSVYL